MNQFYKCSHSSPQRNGGRINKSLNMATSGPLSLFTVTSDSQGSGKWEALPPETCEALPWYSSMQRAWPLFFVMALRTPRKVLFSTAFQSTNHTHSKPKKACFSHCPLYHQFNIELDTRISFYFSKPVGVRQFRGTQVPTSTSKSSAL